MPSKDTEPLMLVGRKVISTAGHARFWISFVCSKNYLTLFQKLFPKNVCNLLENNA